MHCSWASAAYRSSNILMINSNLSTFPEQSVLNGVFTVGWHLPLQWKACLVFVRVIQRRLWKWGIIWHPWLSALVYQSHCLFSLQQLCSCKPLKNGECKVGEIPRFDFQESLIGGRVVREVFSIIPLGVVVMHVTCAGFFVPLWANCRNPWSHIYFWWKQDRSHLNLNLNLHSWTCKTAFCRKSTAQSLVH